MKKTLAILLTYNGARWLDTSLAALIAAEDLVDIAVVDNASTDETRRLLTEKYAGSIQHLHLAEDNLGFGQGHNLVFDQPYLYLENYEYVFLLNQDAFIERTELLELIKIADSLEGKFILSPIHLAEGGARDRWFDRHWNRYFVQEAAVEVGERVVPLRELTFVNAAVWLFPTRLVEAIGGFNPLFKHYGEDTNYVDRARHVGAKVYVADHVTAYHYREQERDAPYSEVEVLGIPLGNATYLVDPSRPFRQSFSKLLVQWTRKLLGQTVRGALGKARVTARHLRALVANAGEFARHHRVKF